MDLLPLLPVLVAALLGGAVQGAIGFGAAFTTAPALAVAAPELLPGGVLIGLLPLTFVMAWRGRREADGAAILQVTAGRVPGIAVGAWVVSLLPPRGLAVALAALLLLAVGASFAGVRVPVTSVSEILAGFVSGVSGTATGLGGPPLALLYRDRSPSFLRSTLAVVWALGLVLAIATLVATRQLTAEMVGAGWAIGAASLVGLAGVSPFVERLSEQVVRRGVLVWAAVGALAALGRAVIA